MAGSERDEPEHARIWARIWDLESRLRAVENIETPQAQRYIRELDELRHHVQRLDVEGTKVTQVRLANIEADVSEIKEDAKGLRVTIRSALITAALSIAVQLVIYFATRSG